MKKKKHWYCFTYAFANGHGCTYTGYPEKGVTLPMIEENKEHARVPKDSVLIACIYLGYMTRQQFKGE